MGVMDMFLRAWALLLVLSLLVGIMDGSGRKLPFIEYLGAVPAAVVLIVPVSIVAVYHAGKEVGRDRMPQVDMSDE